MDNSKISKKQILFLSVLIGVLALVVSFSYIIKPAFSETKELKSETANLEETYNQMMEQSAFFAVNQVNYKNNKENLQKKTENLLPLQKNNKLDTLITNMALSCGLTVGTLKIDNVEECSISMDYNPVENETDSKEENVSDSEDIEETDNGPDAIIYPGAKIEYNPRNDKYTLIYPTGEYLCTMRYGVKGTYSQLQRFVTKLADSSYIGINSIYVKNEQEISEDSLFSMDISIAVNMVGDIPDLSYQGDGADAETE